MNTNASGLPDLYSQFIHVSRYARWLPDQNRREIWPETVERYVDFMRTVAQKRGYADDIESVFPEMYEAILNLEVMPSMRALMTAGPALERDNVAGFNCSYIAVDDPRAFDEIVYILMCGTGVGFSCERQVVSKLPTVPEDFIEGGTIVVEDSKQGWAVAYRKLIEYLYRGITPTWDVSKIREAGARLKVFGGRASGPAPLVDLFNFTIKTFKTAKGRKLESIEVHDLICKIGEVVVVGGVRRSALISLSNLSDQRMRDAKSGAWYNTDAHRSLANNSVAYTEKPEVGQFMAEWNALYASKSGERGIFNRVAAANQCKRFGRTVVSPEGSPIDFGTNPCGEIILRSMQFCNLTEVVCRKEDTPSDLHRKIRIATIMGTLQSCLTDFNYLRPEWKENSEEERLLGVSLTGIMDCDLLNGNQYAEEELSEFLNDLRDETESTNTIWADKLGAERSAAICCVKPSGTVSQLVGSASGIHDRFSPFYIRRVRNDLKDPVTDFLIKNGVPHEKDVFNPNAMVFSFPIRSPEGSFCREERSAIDCLETWLMFKQNWCHHNPSVTINVKEDEWPEVGAWVWKNFDDIGGLSFLPFDEHVYQQAPYEQCDEDTIVEMELGMPSELNWMSFREENDNTTSSQQLACVAGQCELR